MRRGLPAGTMVIGASIPHCARNGCGSSNLRPGRTRRCRRRRHSHRERCTANPYDDEHHEAGSHHDDIDRRFEDSGRRSQSIGRCPDNRPQRARHDTGTGEPNALSRRTLCWHMDANDQTCRREFYGDGFGASSVGGIPSFKWTGHSTHHFWLLRDSLRQRLPPKCRRGGTRPGEPSNQSSSLCVILIR